MYEGQNMMERTKNATCILLVALTLFGLLPHAAFADGDKDKKKKEPVPIVIGPITTTPDPPKKP